ncbi:murein hydrolase activator EnvC family protein [Thalassolituus hydrocarboniclasticus]|uniref:Peptidoglycan DD-metalloendopeptidase family protein n=1 Tax=Thalassolituus hydrocarboniclasticus TaxID=2742796 RepID=A0ABY6A7D2_9GAMM|nr:peptidoglycan DD-metalloendopeptidase family protein [Thalassolituus hydrocarboniclasticus]UXD86547.1 peptidoglycan DD-metalloendopeptidase family protein [Thalassolituus hydrocarboniclasticus]
MKSLLLSGFCLALLCLPAHADDEAKLDALKTEIAKLEQWLNSAKDEYSQLNDALRKSDKDIAELSKQIEQTRARLQEEKDRLKKLRQEQGQLRQLQDKHRLHLAEQLRAAQRIGSEGPLKLLLNQDDPQQAQRMLRYFSYFNNARIEHINQILAELERLDNLAELIAQQEQQLLETEKKLLGKNREIAARKQEQQQLLAKLAGQMKTEQQRLSQKQADRKRLEALLNEVQTLLVNSPRKEDARPITALRGKLPRPVDGRVLYAFGNRNNDSMTRWEGWVMSAPEGLPVRAIHHGRVVYSDWLRGFGLITIIDHGQGYLSLYAHNQTLLRDVGAWVNQGDSIATIGRSGGNAEPGLYFEIRYKGKPQDPAAWLRR